MNGSTQHTDKLEQRSIVTVERDDHHSNLLLDSQSSTSLRCPYCLDSIAQQESWSCQHCQTPMHHKCKYELGGCTSYGCKGRPVTVPLKDAPASFGLKPTPSLVIPSLKTILRDTFSITVAFAGGALLSLISLAIFTRTWIPSRDHHGPFPETQDICWSGIVYLGIHIILIAIVLLIRSRRTKR